MLKVLECEETCGATDTAWSVVGVVISCHSLQFSDQLLWYTHCWHCCTPSHDRWEGEGVYRTVNTVSFQTVSACIVDVCYTCSWGCGMALPITEHGCFMSAQYPLNMMQRTCFMCCACTHTHTHTHIHTRTHAHTHTHTHTHTHNESTMSFLIKGHSRPSQQWL